MNTVSQSRSLTRSIAGTILISVMLAVSGCGKDEVEAEEVVRPVRAMKVGNVTEFRKRRFPGIAKATQEIDLSFRVSGPLITFPVKIGDMVEKGLTVVRIDPRDYEVKLENVRGQLDKAKANAARAESEYQRERNIQRDDPGATSQVNVDRKLAQRDQSRADVKSLKASVAAAKDNLTYTYLKAPFSGIVVNTYVENFEQVQAKQPILRIVDNSRVEMVINVPESLIALAPGATNIEVVFDRYPEMKIPAQIEEIGTEASATTRTYPVTLIMDQPQGITILPGMAGNATGEGSGVQVDADDSGIQVPLAAIFSPDEIEKTYVWLIDEQGMQVSKMEVTRGRLTDTGIIISAGLNNGDLIATAGVHYLREGMKVRLLEEQAQ